MPKVKIKSLTEGYAFIPGYHHLYYLLIPIEVNPQKFSYLCCTISFWLTRVTEENCHLSGLTDVTAASLGHKTTHAHSLFLHFLKKPFQKINNPQAWHTFYIDIRYFSSSLLFS